ncbi:unnamed protein product [Cylicocyclus nassatus]|uniref:Uncharacterized protein n=1 Tax=Cylicocyclus nassatus TaxID=53992 RepID=A0AA36H8N7_CYLNA|nr:unnamed protein product [Cylicocyclus nassatus]
MNSWLITAFCVLCLSMTCYCIPLKIPENQPWLKHNAVNTPRNMKKPIHNIRRKRHHWGGWGGWGYHYPFGHSWFGYPSFPWFWHE